MRKRMATVVAPADLVAAAHTIEVLALERMLRVLMEVLGLVLDQESLTVAVVVALEQLEPTQQEEGREQVAPVFILQSQDCLYQEQAEVRVEETPEPLAALVEVETLSNQELPTPAVAVVVKLDTVMPEQVVLEW